jgi:hypothetical protein
MKKYNIEEKADVVILTICPNCGWFWVKEKEDEIICKNCYEILKSEYINKFGENNFSEDNFKNWIDTNIMPFKPSEKIIHSDSGLLRVRDVCWGCGHTQSVIFYKDRQYWSCSMDGSKNFCLPLMQVINLYFNSLYTKPIKIMRVTKFYRTPKNRVRVVGQELKVLSESGIEGINLIKRKGLLRWI